MSRRPVDDPALRRRGMTHCEDNLGEGEIVAVPGSLIWAFFREELLERLTVPAERGAGPGEAEGKEDG